ncbi:hypothetical protein PTSG_10002 [Salpingoeca rosetta]|uniref:MORN repeat-containing protein 3 n=1 Tax=Salpingoeca rosetta (strain ATCC 50818 / BSB-021) TaxID=946362 RepID=F2UP83_SALR5|nr:uncharacterized protein PTSG_10002 [Salpingoeca rosetta]EGD79438.1 hypothetical protein PTSG_10002 [Salpingoeca rosetta]|eukprot:XP_004988919.1 hypothetical protein PTSG_10002 [Salpingoeca rosetta]
MHGKGMYESKRHKFMFEGDFKYGLRDGYGVYSIFRKGKYHKEYVGSWKANLYHGHGVKFYDIEGTEMYDGEWFEGKRSGWGRMTYADGSVYEGEWLEDQRCGRGLLLLANQNRYEGEWENDLKHGRGTFYYINKGQCYQGVWKDGTPKCGEMIDMERERADDPTKYAIPQLGLKDAEDVLDAAETSVLALNEE